MEDQLIEPVTAEDLSDLPVPSPQFGDWAWEMLSGGRLDLFVRALIAAKIADSKEAALAALVQLAKRMNRKGGPPLWGDLNNDRFHYALFAQLEELTGVKRDRRADSTRVFGIIGHAMVPRLFSGALFLNQPQRAHAGQLELFGEPSPLPLFDGYPNGHMTGGGKAKPLEGKALERVFDRIDTAWQALQANVESSRDWSAWYFSARPEVCELYDALAPIMGDYTRAIQRPELADSGYLAALTAMAWAMVLRLYREELEQPRIFFSEIPIFQPSIHGMGGRRIDALEIATINGKPPTHSQFRVLERMTRYRWGSLVELLRNLIVLFGEFEAEVRDWKFAVGDGTRGKIIQLAEVSDKPIRRHEDQMLTYLIFAAMSHHLAGGGRLWEETSAKRGDMVYFIPTANAISHGVTSAPSEQKQGFLEWVVARWKRAERRADVRALNADLANYLIRTLRGKSEAPRLRRKSPLLDAMIAPRTRAVQLIERYRFVDDARIIAREPDGKFSLHLGNLIEAIRDGEIDISKSFNPGRGGHIRCPFPDHADPGNPSFYVNIPRGAFHCFGCNRAGGIDPRSVPAEYEIAFAPGAGRVRGAKGDVIAVPAEHHRFLAAVQELLHACFIRSAAADYLWRERGLDPDFAYEKGAGFATLGLISALIKECEYSLDELIHYGILGLSENVRWGQSMPQLLARLGFTFETAKRPISSALKGEEQKYGLPYSLFVDGRITFPLTYDGKLTNFYARTIRSEGKPKHLKLSTEHTGVPHGWFGRESFRTLGREVWLVEGVMDALTLEGLGKSTIAYAGIANATITKAVVEAVKRTGNALVVALDNDDAGIKAADALIAEVRKLGFQGEVRNGTPEIISPGSPHDDINTWWVKEGRHVAELERFARIAAMDPRTGPAGFESQAVTEDG